MYLYYLQQFTLHSGQSIHFAKWLDSYKHLCSFFKLFLTLSSFRFIINLLFKNLIKMLFFAPSFAQKESCLQCYLTQSKLQCCIRKNKRILRSSFTFPCSREWEFGGKANLLSPSQERLSQQLLSTQLNNNGGKLVPSLDSTTCCAEL